MKIFSKLRASMAFNIIGSSVIMLLIFSVVVSTIGYYSFSKAFINEYSDTTEHMGQTAATLVNGDNLQNYVNGDNKGEYNKTKGYLSTYCKKMRLSIVYVIMVDTSDYNSFITVFNLIDNSVDNSTYTPWELGSKHDTTNDEYKEKYKKIYEQGSEFECIFRTSDLRGYHPHITAMVPIKDSNGKVSGLMCLQRPMKELSNARKPYLYKVGIAAAVAVVFMAATFALFLRRQFVKPIRRLSSEATRFAAENTEGEKLDDVSRIIEIADLGNAIGTMEVEMLRYINNLTAVTAEKERIGAELSVASTIQENSIPNIFPAFPHRTDFDIYASMTPAKAVGGDFYNFLLVDDDHLAISIGDVSGKGIPAALFMMVTNILISDRTLMGGTPAEILTFVNNNICEHNEADMFVTVWLGILEFSSGKLTVANAGHDDAAICRKGGDFELLNTKHGIVVGAMGGIEYKDFEVQLEKGDKFFLYTDGVPEATDRNEKMFTIDRMINALNDCKNSAPKEILDGVRAKVDEFVGDAEQFDDLTMLCFELKGDSNVKSLTIDATNENLHQVMEFVDDFIENKSCTMKTQMAIDLSVEEIFVNIANYAYGDSVGKAKITIGESNGEVSITFEDSGMPYNPLEKADPDITLSAAQRQIGGLGIFLVKKNMDNVEYEHENGKNIFTITKKL